VKPLEEQNHHEVLEVPPGASLEEIERAYQLTRAAYSDDSLALYSIYSPSDAEVIRSRIDEAYRALTDPAVWEPCDEAVEGPTDSRDAERADSAGREVVGGGPALSGSRDGDAPGRAASPLAEVPTAIDVFEDLDAEVDESEQDFDGPALRRARLRRGVELDQIAQLTKVSARYLRCIEAEDFDDLPAVVYVRGFVTAYARAIGLDPERVAGSYMPRVDAARNQKRKGGLLGRN
jgi:DnaJ-class molecular chaperone